MESKKAAEIAFENVYHEYVPIMDEEAALERASAVYHEICGEYPDLVNQFGFDWFDENTINQIITGTWSNNNL